MADFTHHSRVKQVRKLIVIKGDHQPNNPEQNLLADRTLSMMKTYNKHQYIDGHNRLKKTQH